jgi:hypothetical protein
LENNTLRAWAEQGVVGIADGHYLIHIMRTEQRHARASFSLWISVTIPRRIAL